MMRLNAYSAHEAPRSAPAHAAPPACCSARCLAFQLIQKPQPLLRERGRHAIVCLRSPLLAFGRLRPPDSSASERIFKEIDEVLTVLATVSR